MTTYRTAANDNNFTSMYPPTVLLIAVLIGMADASVKVTCPSDMNVIADRGSEYALVTWSPDDFRLQSDNHIRGLYQTVPQYGAPANVSKHFAEGEHYIEYRAVDSTGRMGICSFMVNVRAIRCPVLARPAFATVRCNAGNFFGSQCSVECQTGYSAGAENQVIECDRQSVWSGELPQCLVSKCEDPGTPLYGSRDCSSGAHVYGSRCSFTCRHGYRLHGSSRLTCVVNATGSTTWSATTPSCQDIIPPFIESCPNGPIVHMTTSARTTESGSEVTVEVVKPNIVFRLAGKSGPVTSHSCTRFADGRSDRFTVGRHVVTCTALEDGDIADGGSSSPGHSAQCQFVVDVQVDRCKPLNQPSGGSLMCSATSSLDDGMKNSNNYVTSCRLFCGRNHVLPRPVDENVQAFNRFECDGRVGVWTPTNAVPSCVVPVRPEELKLPVELLYSAPFDCLAAPTSSEIANSLSLLSSRFELAVQQCVQIHQVCPKIDQHCIVEEVRIRCHSNSGADAEDDGESMETSPSRRRRRRRTRSTAATTLPVSSTQSSAASESSNHRRRNQRRNRKPRRPSAESIAPVSSGSMLSIQFHLSTRLPSNAPLGLWPNEYHIAATRLRAAFDAFRDQLTAGNFQLQSPANGDRSDELVGMRVLVDSLTDAPLQTSCPDSYSLNETTHLCVPCGPGSTYSIADDRCNST